MVEKQKVAINPINKKDDKCFQYAVTTTLNYQNIKHNPERITKIKPFINNYDWNGIYFPSHEKDWNKFELNNKKIALNVVFIPYNTKQIRLACIPKYNSNRGKQANLLMVTDNNKKWHYLFRKRLSALLKGIISVHVGDFCLNCFYSFTTENVLEKHENVCQDHDYCYVEMFDKDNSILKYNSEEKHMRVLFIMYVDMECLLENISTCHNDPNKSSTIKIDEHTPSGYSLLAYCSFDNTKNRLSYYRGQDCKKMLCKELKEHAKRVIYCEKKEMISLTDEENESYENQTFCYICKKNY